MSRSTTLYLMKMINIIAEIGSNHAGDISLAKEMVSAAKESGANYAKFQSWREKNLREGPWDKDEPFFDFKNKREFYKKAELLDDQHHELINHCNKVGIKFLTTCCDKERAAFLSSLSMSCVKVASPDSTDDKIVGALRDNFDRVIVSTGMTKNNEIDKIIKKLCPGKYTIMHCVSIYPTPLNKISLNRLESLRDKVTSNGGDFGVSDHSPGINFVLTAIAKGATWIEKHFTINNKLTGPDNKISILPNELKTIRNFSEDFLELQSCQESDSWEQEIDLRKVISGRFAGDS